MADLKFDIDVNTAPVDRAIRVMDNLEAELRDVQRAFNRSLITEEQFEAETKRLTQSMARLNIVAKGSAKDFRAFEKTVYGSGKAMRRKEIAMQQAGYQLQDFIVQVQAGTNPLIAFSQQGSQLAGFFAGPWGAAIGLGIAALGGLGTALLGTRGQTKSLLDTTQDFLDVVEDYNGAAGDASVGVDNLSEAFGTLAGTVKEARDAILELRRVQVEQEFQGLSKGFIDQYAMTGGGDVRQILANIFGAETGFGGFTMGDRNVGAELKGILSNVVGARETERGPEARATFLKDALVSAKELALVDGNINEEEKELLDTLEKMYSAYESIVEKQEERNTLSTEVSAKQLLAKEKAMAAMQEEIGKGQAKRDKEYLELQAKLEKDLMDDNLAYEKKIAKEAEVLARKTAKEDKILLEAQAKRELELMQENARYEAEQDKKRKQEREDDFLNTLNYQYSLVEGTLGDVQDEMDTLKDAAEELGIRLGMGFDQAVNLIRQAKVEATVGLDAFGGAGDFKYSVPTTFDPDKGKRKGPKKRDPLADLQKQINLEQALIGKTEARQRIIQALGVDFMKYGSENIANIEAQIEKTMELEAAEKQRLETLEAAKRQQEELTNFIGDSFEDAMMSIVDGTKSVEDAFRTMAVEIIKELYRVLVVQQAVAAFKLAGKALGIPFLNADGNAFSNGRVTPFANGGVVASPTYFPMAGGNTGLMGEAGPEAIMPLKRGKDGKLGVQAEGGGTTIVNQTINVSTGVQQTVRTEIKSLMPQIAEGAKSAVLDAKRRGGAYGRTL